MSDLERDVRLAPSPRTAPRHAPRPRLWAGVNVLVGPLLWWWLAATLSGHSSPPLPPVGLVVPLTVGVSLLALAVLVAVVMRRWRWAVCLAAVYALPLTVVGVGTLILFGLGAVALVPAASWWAVIVSSARRLAWDERSVGEPSPEQRARRVRGWSLLLVTAGSVPAAGVVVAVVRAGDPAVSDGVRVLTLALAAALTVTAAGAVVLLALALASRWDTVGTASTALLAGIVTSALLGAIVGLAFVVLLLIPLIMASSHAQQLRPGRVTEHPVVAA